MEIQLVASDLDGTIIDRNNHIAIDNFKAIDKLQEKNVKAEIKFSHERIPSEDICYSYEEIFNKVLNGVEKI